MAKSIPDILTGAREPREPVPTHAMASEPSAGEATVSALLAGVQDILDALRKKEDEMVLAIYVRGLHKAYEEKWARLRAAAAALDEAGIVGTEPTKAASSPELEALKAERATLRGDLATRNRELKEEIDSLRQLLSSVQLSMG